MDSFAETKKLHLPTIVYQMSHLWSNLYIIISTCISFKDLRPLWK